MKSFEPCLENFRLGGEFYRLFEHIPKIMFFAKDRKRWLFMGNRRFLEHCGFTSVEELVGKSDIEMFMHEKTYIAPRLGEARVSLANNKKMRSTFAWMPVLDLEKWVSSQL
tara:strand:+ start:359 stop:691 length:333 start_codon:yes stop_codon:yes gene_type:complete